MMENEQKPSRPVADKVSDTAPAQDQTNLKPEIIAAKTPPSGFSKFLRGLRMGLIGLVVAVVLFFAGFLTDHFVRFLPLRVEFDSTKLQLSDAEKQVTGLTDQLTTANSQITGMNADLTAANTHIELLQAVKEVQAAYIALESSDLSGAKVALVNTPKRLENLKPVVQPVDATLAENMSNRLAMVLTAMDTNAATAKADLAQLAKNLLNIEELLYK
jgi:hypothetical protein